MFNNGKNLKKCRRILLFLSFQIFFSNSTQLVKMTCDDADCLSTNALFSFGTGKERLSMFQVVSIHKHGRDSQDTHKKISLTHLGQPDVGSMGTKADRMGRRQVNSREP